GLNIDIAAKHPDAQTRAAAQEFAALITPVVKAYFTDAGFENAVQAMQVYGGHGYIREWGMEQFVRDARIAMIYEGANGIQALDLVGRKLPQNMGRLLRRFFHPVDDFIQENMADPELKDYVMPLAKAFGRLQSATQHVAMAGLKNPDEAGAASSDYLRLFGLVALGFMWARMAKVAKQKLAEGTAEPEFYRNKLVTGRFFMERMLPDTSGLLSKVTAGGESMMALEAEAF
ncbi:MAG TPA: acyl-CoA dehydrogenase C-terminal domain-containing protein, partial [Alphaproteobacteria bacterium]|nr:acyl-CoA dehydrogenase C-terminal domain-containing protein [Alphaproteobacteria bacterium]